MSSIIKGSVNWTGEAPKTKTKGEIKKEPVITKSKKLKSIESLLKKLDGIKSESSELYECYSTSELSTVISLLLSVEFNLKRLKSENTNN
jgi:hypothetical protein